MKTINDPKELNKYIKQYNILACFEKDMSPYMTLIEYDRAENILVSMEPMLYFYFVVEGKVKIFKTSENGKSVLLRIPHPLTELGSLEVLQSNRIVDSNVQALHKCKVIRIPFTAIEAHAKDDVTFYKYIVTRLSHKLATISNTASMNATYPFKSRFASYLVSTTKTKSVERIEEIKFQHLTDLATFLGTSYRHLNRVLRELEDDGIIRKNKKSLSILDFNRLEELSGGYYD